MMKDNCKSLETSQFWIVSVVKISNPDHVGVKKLDKCRIYCIW